MAERKFPILGFNTPSDRRAYEALDCPRSVPWSLVEPHAAQAMTNHGQTLERLAQRGGLCPIELTLVLCGWAGRRYREVSLATAVAAIREDLELLEWKDPFVDPEPDR